jgi:hypothetical protein
MNNLPMHREVLFFKDVSIERFAFLRQKRKKGDIVLEYYNGQI